MVSLQDFDDSRKKRKWEMEGVEEECSSEKLSKFKSMRNMIQTELNHETPFPLDWQRCLDIKSGQIYYYNTRTQQKTYKDPRRNSDPDPPVAGHMSLDLELNLPCGSAGKNHVAENFTDHSSGGALGNIDIQSNKNAGALRSLPPWLSQERDDHREMVMGVCKKCHMLVMMCKSSPACPNCKFVHSPEQSTPELFNRSLSLSC